MDILVAKLHRYEEKDLFAFKEVYRHTGFPSPEALLQELRASPRLFAKRDRSLEHVPAQYPESNLVKSIPKLWRDLWGLKINVRRDIIDPVGIGLKESYGDYKTGHVHKLKTLAQEKAFKKSR